MRKGYSGYTLGIKALFLSILFLLSGCATATKPAPEAKKGVLNDVLVFRQLQDVDLNNDGSKETVAVYAASNNSSGVKVISFQQGKGEVVFEQIFNTPKVSFMMRGNTPALIVEETIQKPGSLPRQLKTIYHWDGKAFTPSGK